MLNDSIELFSQELWRLPAAEAARRCYTSLLPLCEGDLGSSCEGYASGTLSGQR
jgi:hypothetical protein